MTWEERAEQVLSALEKLSGAKRRKPVTSSRVGEEAGYSRRMALYYLVWLKEQGKAVQPSPKRWALA
jgi:hypothetical protein